MPGQDEVLCNGNLKKRIALAVRQRYILYLNLKNQYWYSKSTARCTKNKYTVRNIPFHKALFTLPYLLPLISIQNTLLHARHPRPRLRHPRIPRRIPLIIAQRHILIILECLVKLLEIGAVVVCVAVEFVV